MKRLVYIILFALTYLRSCEPVYAQFAGGSGTAIAPYQISTTLQFDSIRNHKSAYFILNNNIDFTGYSWTPIDTLFGQLDGNHFTIKNLYVSRGAYTNGAIFLNLQGCTIKNISFDNCQFYPLGAYYGMVCGFLAGASYGSVDLDSVIISNLTYKAFNSNFGDLIEGGIIGEVYPGQSATLNRIGIINSTISDSVYGTPNLYWGIAGFIGSANNVTVTKSYISNVIMKDYAYWNTSGGITVAGMLGYPHSCSITDSYVNAKFNTLNLSSKSIAGLLGFCGTLNTITNCYAVDSLTVLLNNVNKEYFDYDPNLYNPTITNCYADSTIGYALGFSTTTGLKSTSQMQIQSTYSGMDFTNIWAIQSDYNNNYPYLKWALIIEVIQPYTATLYNTGDSVKIVVLPSAVDTQTVYINYSGTYNLVGTFIGDSAKFKVDSISANAQFKLVDKATGATVYSNFFRIYPATYISIDTVYFNTSNVFIQFLHNGVTSVKSYYSPDSFSWQYLGTSVVADTLIADTVSYPRLLEMNTEDGYYKIIENLDTTVYGLKINKISDFSLAFRPQICYSFAFNDNTATGFPGGNLLKDLGCGWAVGNGSYYNTISTIVDTSGSIAITSHETYYPAPNNPPPLSSHDVFQSVTYLNPFIYAGREYWVSITSTQYYFGIFVLWMKDMIHNVSYPVMSIAGTGVGIVANWSNGVEAKSFPNDILIFRSLDGLDAFSCKALPYPVSNNPVQSVYHLITQEYQYGNRFQILQPRF